MLVQSDRRTSIHLSGNDDLLHAVVSRQTHQALALLQNPNLSQSAVDFRDPEGWTPLMYACSRGEVELAKELLQRGASVNAVAENDGVTALHICATAKTSEAGTDDYLSTAAAVMSRGGNPYQDDAAGFTPIHVAARQGNTEMKLLLESCALFRGVLSIRTPRLFGERMADRVCLLQPRYAWGGRGREENDSMVAGFPKFELVCYKDRLDVEPKTVLALPPELTPLLQTKDSTSGNALLGMRAEGLGFLCKAGFSWTMGTLGLPEGLAVVPQEEQFVGQDTFDGDVQADIKPEKKTGRKSMSFARFGKAAMRRMSIGGDPRRNSLTREDSQSRKSKTYTRKMAEQSNRISEETPEEKAYDRRKSKTFEKLKDFGRRMSVHSSRRSIDIQQGGFSLRQSKRQAALQAQKVFLHSLPRHPGDAAQFWERIYSELSKITDESAARVPTSAEAEPHTPRGQTVRSVDSGHLQFESPRSNAAVRDRTSQDSGHVDWEHRDVSNRGGVPKGSPRPVLPLESIPPEALGDAALDESALPHPPHVLRPLQEGDMNGRFQPNAPEAKPSQGSTAPLQQQYSRNSSGALSIEEMQDMSNLNKATIILDSDSPSSLQTPRKTTSTTVSPSDKIPKTKDVLLVPNTPSQNSPPTASKPISSAGTSGGTSGDTLGSPASTGRSSAASNTHSQQQAVAKQANLKHSFGSTPAKGEVEHVRVSPFARMSAVLRTESDELEASEPPSTGAEASPGGQKTLPQPAASPASGSDHLDEPVPQIPSSLVDTAKHLKEIVDLRGNEIKAMHEQAKRRRASEENAPSGAGQRTKTLPATDFRPTKDSSATPQSHGVIAADEIFDTQVSMVETFLDTMDHNSMVPRHVNPQGAPNDNLMSFLKQQGERQEAHAPRPVTGSMFNNDTMFGSKVEVPDDVFVWTLRPRQYRTSNTAKLQPQKQAAFSQLASEATQLLEADKKMLEAALEGLQQEPSQLNAAQQASQKRALQDGIINPKILKQPSGEALPEVLALAR